MVVFEKVTYQNFLATGNVPITIPLNAHNATLIVGRNGAGKSTMTEAVCYALFGRPLRNVNKPALVNSINKRDMLVELWVSTNGHRYQIRRGMKPTVFEIYQDGALLPMPAAVADYQAQLESLIGLNYKSFMQIVILGSASYVPFMRLAQNARRDIVEDLLDIEIFSYMGGLAKDELSNVKTQAETLQQERTLLDEQRRLAESFTAQVTESQEARAAQLATKIEATTAMVQSLLLEIQALEANLTAFDPVHDAHRTATEKQGEYQRTMSALHSRVKKLDKEHAFYSEHDDCPTCAQMLDPTFKATKFADIDRRRGEIDKAIAQCEHILAKYTTRLTELDAQLADAALVQDRLRTKQAQLPIHRRQLRELQAEQAAAQTPPPAPAGVDLEDLATRIAAAQAAFADISKRKSIVETATTLLRDSGIKARLVKHYLPIINKQINHYLTAMDFPIHFTLDDQFQEHIQSLHRDDFTYESFSEGEKKRIDLALLLTWRDVARLKNSASCNLLVMDEVFDSSLDVAGVEEVMRLIPALEKVNVFIISHRTDQLIDKFSNVLTFTKERGFSALR